MYEILKLDKERVEEREKAGWLTQSLFTRHINSCFRKVFFPSSFFLPFFFFLPLSLLASLSPSFFSLLAFVRRARPSYLCSSNSFFFSFFYWKWERSLTLSTYSFFLSFFSFFSFLFFFFSPGKIEKGEKRWSDVGHYPTMPFSSPQKRIKLITLTSPCVLVQHTYASYVVRTSILSHQCFFSVYSSISASLSLSQKPWTRSNQSRS